MKKKIFVIVALVMIASLCFSLAGCSSNTGNDSIENSNKSMSNTLVYAGESENTINPILNTHDELPSIIFSGLMKFDGNNQPIVDLAKSYTYDDKTFTYTFQLRQG